MDIYIVKISNKYFNKLLRYHIEIQKIKKKKDYYLLYLDFNNYKKILKFKRIFEIELVDLQGIVKYKNIIKNNLVFFIIFIFSIIYIILLSNIIFKIDVKTNNKEIKELVIKELNKYNLSIYKRVLSFNEKENIKKKIINNNKEKLEWMEITRKGSSYIINVEERIIKELDNDNSPRDIVALKNAIILSIEAKSGSIVKKLNDYVKKGDIIVTGSITHKDSVVDTLKADAVIYGETWYNVHVSYPMSFYEKTFTGEKTKRINFQLLNKNFIIGKKYKDEEKEELKIISNKYLPIKITLEDVKEVVLIDDIYTVDEAYIEGVKLAREKLLSKLPKDSKILDQKKLKIIVNNSTIDIDIFFKVYENITDTRKIDNAS